MSFERKTQLLNGLWDYRIGEGKFVKKQIPYSDPPVGFATCRLDFDALPIAKADRAFLVFDGITYEAEVTLNGHDLGKMLPYCEYRFEITDCLKEQSNRLEVLIRDTEVMFGAGEGWENYSGITRNVYIEYTAKNILRDVFFHSSLNESLTEAACTAEIKADGPADGLFLLLSLSDPSGKEIYTRYQAVTDSLTVLEFPCISPILWSPNLPVLYTLEVSLCSSDAPLDTYTCAVGFKHLTTQGRRFFLNGKPFFLCGICRHEIWGEQGHMLTDGQIETDLRMIKSLGCNYVRLVHYPHRKKTLELADKLGLFVSEEPGLWWSDMKDQSIVDASLEVLRRTVIRDRNHVSVAFWLSFNECIFTPEYLLASAETCRKYDPYRMISGANCMNIEMTKQQFAACRLDFYTMHPYHPTPDQMTVCARELTDKPLVFTEWGGWPVFNSPFMMQMFWREITRLWQESSLAGSAYWCWSEMYEINRAAPACYDGLQCEGLVDRFRKPTAAFETFRQMVAQLDQPPSPPHFLTKTDFYPADGDHTPLPLDALAKTEAQKAAWERMMQKAAEPIPKFHFECRNTRHMSMGPALPEAIDTLGQLPVDLLRKPLVIDSDTPFEITLSADTKALSFIGMTSMPCGFPIDGAYGETAAEIILAYGDGSKTVRPIRNGKELTTACAWYGPSRINPRAENAPRAIHFINDMDREHYVANLYTLSTENGKNPFSVRLRVANGNYNILLYGITVQR